MRFIREGEDVDLKLKNQSDHFALEAIVRGQSAHCTPSDAWDFFRHPPIAC